MKAIAAAMVKAQREFGPALKTSTNPHFRSKYADLSACVEAVIDALNNNGIYLMQLTEEHESGVKVSTVFIHESGEQMSGGSLFMPASKHDAQGFGSALSYARRYSLMAACGIAPEDDDANSAKAPAPKAVAKAAPAVEKPMPKEVPKQEVSGSVANPWGIKVTVAEGASNKDWAAAVAEGTSFALEMAQNVDDVNSIYKVNKDIFAKLDSVDKVTYSTLLAKFKQFKEKFMEKKNDEYVPE
jgi:hypothetical protein